MNEEHYLEAAKSCERIAEGLRVRADLLDSKAADRRLRANKHKAKAIKLDRAAQELRDAAKTKARESADYRSAALLLPRLNRKCIGCALGYVPEGETYRSIHSCGQTVGGPLRAVGE